jgi:hypothetical protein
VGRKGCERKGSGSIRHHREIYTEEQKKTKKIDSLAEGGKNKDEYNK